VGLAFSKREVFFLQNVLLTVCEVLVFLMVFQDEEVLKPSFVLQIIILLLEAQRHYALKYLAVS
jgi:hypothetical protein